ncbi:MAG: hypothetical protein GY953_41975 [bacterium]|nr:hypothetical protein [bacterium]
MITVRMIDEIDARVTSAGESFWPSIDEPVMVDREGLTPRGSDVPQL